MATSLHDAFLRWEETREGMRCSRILKESGCDPVATHLLLQCAFEAGQRAGGEVIPTVWGDLPTGPAPEPTAAPEPVPVSER